MRVVLLIALVAGSGVAAGFALGYPLRELDLGASDAPILDQVALAGTIDAERALIMAEDLPNTYAADESFAAAVSLVGAEYCGQTIVPTDPQGDALTRAYVDRQNKSFMLSQVVRVREQNSAGKYIREMINLFDGCDGQQFFKEDNVEVSIEKTSADPPLGADYVQRTLVPKDGGTIQIVTYFQVGNVIVAIQYAGPAKPKRELMSKAETEILYRVAPDQVSKTAQVDGSKPLPGESEGVTTTTGVDAVTPSPTSSPTAEVPALTPAPDPTFETPTTKKSR